MSDITGENPDYTDDDLAILSVGAWNPDDTEENTEKDSVAEAGSSPDNTLDKISNDTSAAAPSNPWADPETAEDYAQNQESKEPTEGPGTDTISRVDLQPGGIKAAIEAILAVADTPVSVRDLSAALIVSEYAVEKSLDELYREYSGYDDGQTVHEPRGFELRRINGGWRLYSRADFSPWVSRFVVGEATAKLPKAVMETLSVVAYQQPTTRAHVSSVRGVSVDAAFRTLLKRGLIAQTVPEPGTGSHQYITTELFLEKLGLNSLDDLPAIAPYLPDIDDLELATQDP